MKTFIYYSPSNKEVIAISANDSKQACNQLSVHIVNNIIKDDYYFATSLTDKFGDCGAFDVSDFDSLSEPEESIPDLEYPQ